MRFVLTILVCAATSVAMAATTDPVAVADQLLATMTTEEKTLQLLSYCPNGIPRLGLPSLNAGEALHGVVTEGATNFPQAIAQAATWDPDLQQRMAVVIAKEGRAVGVHQVFAPMLGLARDPRWGRVEESYGEDPWLVTRMGVAYVSGLQGLGAERFGNDKLIATPKHFVADGEPWGGHNGSAVDVTERVLRETHFRPFEAVIREAKAGSLMPAHHQLNGVPCHANTWLLGTILRQEWGFDGFITSDMGDIDKLGWGHHFAIDGERDPVVLALKAGVDMELVGKFYKQIPQLIKTGHLTMADLDTAARRVLIAKLTLLGLGTQPPSATNQTQETILAHQGTDDIWAALIAQGKFTSPKGARRADADQVLNDPAHDALALTMAQKALVLLRNEQGMLPLDPAKTRNLLVVGPLAKQVNTGGYSSASSKRCITALEGITAVATGSQVAYAEGCTLGDTKHEYVPEADVPLLAEARTKAVAADVIVAVVGHSRKQVGENLDRDDLGLVGGQQALVEAMVATGKPVVVVLENGAPLSIPWIATQVPAILESWYGGQYAGTAIGQALFGLVNPGGRMPVTVPKHVGQVPCYYNHLPLTGPPNYFASKWANLYPFGHGLSYTTFIYDPPVVSPEVITRDQSATITTTIHNTGTRSGDEVVQLYLHQDDTNPQRPVKELRGFKRITLEPGAAATVTFTIGFEELKFWRALSLTTTGWGVEPGRITVMIGSSSEDIRQKTTLTLR